ncbi:hypothetical protein [uncultured Pseudokineococcus sp.]|uniref:hypothetical protein n=1 Tax=uncultured Pseudokineococcus sp. TaxID=1642928 RepID=UPI0026090D9D|nr:hypothetical protein [uncultured Pseudokineococcus sp.]
MALDEEEHRVDTRVLERGGHDDDGVEARAHAALEDLAGLRTLCPWSGQLGGGSLYRMPRACIAS